MMEREHMTQSCPDCGVVLFDWDSNHECQASLERRLREIFREECVRSVQQAIREMIELPGIMTPSQLQQIRRRLDDHVGDV